VLPAEWHYLVDTCSDNGSGVEAVLHVDARTNEEAAKWLQQYEALSLATLRMVRTWPKSGVKVLLKVHIMYVVYLMSFNWVYLSALAAAK